MPISAVRLRAAAARAGPTAGDTPALGLPLLDAISAVRLRAAAARAGPTAGDTPALGLPLALRYELLQGGEVDYSRKPSGPMRPIVFVGGRPAPPPPPAGPVSRVSSSLGMRPPAVPPPSLGPRVPFGLPSLRRNVCPHFYMTGPRGTIPIQAPHLLKALMRSDQNVARCQLRGGVHLDQGYVSDICLSSRFNQCVFYEDELTGR